MQNVSAEYRESMSQTLRNRGYLRVEFGLPDVTSQSNAVLSGGMFWLSNPSKIFKNGTDDFVYAALEGNFIKTDGSMYIPPVNSQGYLQETSLISDVFPSDQNYVFSVSFGDHIISSNNIRLNFGENYPVDFDITDSNGNTCEIRDNDQSILSVEYPFEAVTDLTFTIINMKNTDDRFRLYSMNFGLGLIYDNDSILDSGLNRSISLINETLPTMNFSVTLMNEDHYFDIDNPKSVLNLFDTSTKVNLSYGYQIDENTIEWVPGGELYAYDWSTGDDSVTISARDVLQNFDVEYIYGSVGSTSLYALAEKVFQTMGITEFTISDDLLTMYTSNPIPRISCKEALQIIANLSLQPLMLTRSGGVKIGGDHSIAYTSNGDYYGKLSSITTQSEKTLYASLEQDLIKADGSPYIAPTNFSNCENTGYVSTFISGDDGFFVRISDNVELVESALNDHIGVLEYILQSESFDSTNIPKITITFSDVATIRSIKINFGETISDIVRVGCFIGTTEVNTVTVTDNAQELLEVAFESNQMDKIEIQFIKTLVPNRRVYVDWMQVIDGSNFTITRNDMLSVPSFTKFLKIKEINVPWYMYQVGLNEDKLLEQEVTVEDTSTVYRFYMSEPCSGYRLSVSSGTASIVEYGNFYLDVTFSVIGTKTLIVYGKKYTVVEQIHTKSLNDDGETINWKNPLVDSEEKAATLGEWLFEYYQYSGSYDYQTRGNPELDVNDMIYQEHYSGKKFEVYVTDTSLNFNGAFSGSVKMLRLGGE